MNPNEPQTPVTPELEKMLRLLVAQTTMILALRLVADHYQKTGGVILLPPAKESN